VRFEIDPQPDETRRACAAIAQAALPPSRGGLIIVALYAAVITAAYFLTPGNRAITVFIPDPAIDV